MTNQNLPELSVWGARSTYAVLIAILFTVLDSLGVVFPDEIAPEQVTDMVFTFAPIFGVLWAAWERRAPNYRLVLFRKY